MRWFLLFFVLVCRPVSGSSQILLNEIYYDHPGRDDGREFIELFNAGLEPRSLGGYALEFHDGSSVGWRRLWTAGPGDSVAGSGLFVAGGDSVRPAPDAALALALQNGPDAVRLVRDGVVVDRLGYGELTDPDAYEGSSAPDVAEGWGLGRYPDGFDTDDNAHDFRALVPSPGRFNRPRRNVAVRRAADTPERAVVDAAADRIGLYVVNRGLGSVGPGEVAVVLLDSTESLAPVDSVTIARHIEEGDSIEVLFDFFPGHGYHHVRAVAAYAPDERPDDNRVDLLRRVGDPPIIVSEVMSFPAPGCPEYVEIYNAGAGTYNVTGYHIRDAAHTASPFAPDPLHISPGEFVVVTSDRAALGRYFPDAGVVVEMATGWPSLNHTGSGNADSVIVLDHYALPVDRVAYPPQPSDARGRSLERVDLFPGTRGHTWLLSTDPSGGSPGRRNPEALAGPPAGGVSAAPNPFDPESGESLLITVPERAEPTRLLVHVFDVDGRRLRDVGSVTEFPYVLVWDGRDDHGTRVTPGIYVLACEFFSLRSGKRTVERVVVGCARKTR